MGRPYAGTAPTTAIVLLLAARCTSFVFVPMSLWVTYGPEEGLTARWNSREKSRKGEDKMGLPVLILGESGSGKSASLRNFEPEEISIFNVAGKPLPFRKKIGRAHV